MSKEITVIKFGGSVLKDTGDLAKAVNEIYRNLRSGTKVLVVVSAFNGRTDELLATARAFGADDNAAAASLLLTGESESAALLTLALQRAGLPAKVLTPAQIGLLTRGETFDAEPIWADTEKLRDELASSIVVVSGFGGVDAHGAPTLLGRGGSDLTALFLAERLDARCILVKDVDGLYESDPAVTTKPRRFASASYVAAARIGGPLIQQKAVEFAAENSLTVELRSLNSDTGTVISNLPDTFAADTRDARPLRIALLGCGTVGGGVFELLAKYPEKFEIVGVLNRERDRALAAGIPEHLIENDAERLFAKEHDVVIELIGGTDAAGEFIERSLRSGRSVVTANKALLTERPGKFTAIAAETGASLLYSASVGGALPAFELIGKNTDDIAAVTCILNGTCNFICERLAAGEDIDPAVAAAQAKGFAEADPTLDITGTDAAQKLSLLAKNAFGADIPVAAIERKGIEDLTPEAFREAASRGRTIRLIGEITRTDDGVKCSVAPREVAADGVFGTVTGAGNCLVIRESDGRERVIKAAGAGRYPTAESVIADVFELYRKHKNAPRRLAARTAEAAI